MNKKRLGKGLSALIPDVPETHTEELPSEVRKDFIEIDIEDIRPNPLQPRTEFHEESLHELAETITSYGVINPIIVQKDEQGGYVLVAGERRVRAAQIAGLEKIPALVKQFSQEEFMEITLVENLQREDLNPLDEALAYRRLLQEFHLTQDELSKRLGRSRTAIANSLRLLSLDDEVKNYMVNGQLTAGQARPLLALEDATLQRDAAMKVVKENLSARAVEKMIKELLKNKTITPKGKSEGDIERTETDEDRLVLQELEDRLRKQFGTKVKIRHGKREGKIEVSYYGAEDLERLSKLLLNEREF